MLKSLKQWTGIRMIWLTITRLCSLSTVDSKQFILCFLCLAFVDTRSLNLQISACFQSNHTLGCYFHYICDACQHPRYRCSAKFTSPDMFERQRVEKEMRGEFGCDKVNLLFCSRRKSLQLYVSGGENYINNRLKDYFTLRPLWQQTADRPGSTRNDPQSAGVTNSRYSQSKQQLYYFHSVASL